MRFFSIPSLFVCVVLLCSGLLLGQPSSPESSSSSSSSSPSVDFVIRMGQGGFSDDRSPARKLGGGQVNLDVYPRAWPVGISIFTEYYTNSASPTHSYEIADLIALNLLFRGRLFGVDRMHFFLGGGAGWVLVPVGEDSPDEYLSTDAYNLEAGVDVLAFWKIGFYGIGKYLYANRVMNNVAVIDFDEAIVMLGITFYFSL